MDNFEYQALRNVLKEGEEDGIDNFEKYRELKIDPGYRNSSGSGWCVLDD